MSEAEKAALAAAQEEEERLALEAEIQRLEDERLAREEEVSNARSSDVFHSSDTCGCLFGSGAPHQGRANRFSVERSRSSCGEHCFHPESSERLLFEHVNPRMASFLSAALSHVLFKLRA
jgi:hypothetical protein